MREALARVDIPAFVAIFRIASGLSQLDLANLIPGWSQTLVCLTEKGTRCTFYDIRRFLAFTDLIGMPRTALLPLILGRSDAILECDAAAAPQGAEDMDRREFSMLAAGLTAAALLPLPAQVDRGHVRYLQSTLVRLRTQDNVAGGGAVLPQALRHFAYARRLLDESDYSPAIGRELLADSAGDGAQRAYLYANMVQQSTSPARYTGQKGYAREALRFAERATAAARHVVAGDLDQAISHGLTVLPDLGTTLTSGAVPATGSSASGAPLILP